MFKNTWWYRLLQVVYGVSLIVSLLGAMVFIYKEHHPRQTPLSFNEFVQFNNSADGSLMAAEDRTTGSWMSVILFSTGAILLICGVFLAIRKLFFYVYQGNSSKKEDRVMQDIFDGFMNQKYTKIHNVAGLGGIDESPKKYSVGEEINDEKVFHTIKLLQKGVYDCQEKLGEAIVYYNRSDVRPRPEDYAEGIQDTFGLLEALEAGRVAICSKTNKKFYFEIKKATFRDETEERDRYFFPDGICFFDIRTKSITPRLK